MSLVTVRFCLGMTVWALALLGSLSIARLPGDWGHGICGPWGCGPPLQSLVACHVSWLVALGPATAILASSRWLSARVLRRAGATLALAGIIGLLAIVLHQCAFWLPIASEWQRPYFWHRCGFVIATTVDLPFVQISTIGLVLAFSAGSRRIGETAKRNLGATERPNLESSSKCCFHLAEDNREIKADDFVAN